MIPIQAPNNATCRYTNLMLPVKDVIASATRFSSVADAASCLRRSARTRMLRSSELLRLPGCGGATVGVADTMSG